MIFSSSLKNDTRLRTTVTWDVGGCRVLHMVNNSLTLLNFGTKLVPQPIILKIMQCVLEKLCL